MKKLIAILALELAVLLPAQTPTYLACSGAGMSRICVAANVNGIYSSSAFGIKCDGATDDSTGLNAIGTFTAAQTAGNTVSVSFPSNAVCVHASTITTWNQTNLHVQGNGARLKFTGTGKQIYLHGGGGATEYDNLWIQGFVLQGNPNATDGIYQDNGIVARSRFDIINAQDFTDACFYMPNIELSEYIVLNCSAGKATIMGTPQVTTPNYGLIAGDPSMLGGVGFWANNEVATVRLEGVKLIGLWCKVCSNQNHFFGTAEEITSSGGTVGVGLVDASANYGQGNTFSLDLEGNAVADAQISGFGETFLSTVSLGNFVVLSGGLVNIIGGEFQTITLNSGHNTAFIEGIYYNGASSTGTVTGYTASDCLINVQNRVGGAVINQCFSGMYLALAGGNLTGNVNSAGIFTFGGASVVSASAGDAVLENANALRSSSSVNNATFRLIKGTTGSGVWLDPDGQGVVVGNTSAKIPFVSTTTPTAGAGVCWKTATTQGTCTAGTWPNCTTCN
jgi:hypothetical protein